MHKNDFIMKRFLCILLSLITLSTTAGAQRSRLLGSWNGKLEAGGSSLTLVFHFTTDSLGKTYFFMDSPDQGAEGILGEIALLDNDSVSVTIPMLGAAYQGRLVLHEVPQGSRPSGEIQGIFTQMGMRFPLVLQMGVPVLNRPQEPQPPYPYRSEEVTFSSGADGAVMAGTLTYPVGYDDNSSESDHTPAVLMITGSGSQNRDEELFSHKPFLVLADWLARHGIASLRYDDRGMGESERGTVEITTQTNMQDALAGIRYLRSLGEFDKVGALGHSEGGQIVFMLGAAEEADFIISMAGPGMRGDSILVEQNRLILTKSGFTPASADNYGRVLAAMLRMKVDGYSTDSPETLVDSLITALDAQNIPFGSAANLATVWSSVDDPWMLYFLQSSPARDISRTTCPVFALNGSLDLQVPPVNLEHIRRLLPDGPHNLIKEYPGLNHLLQPCTTGIPTEYGRIETTIAPEVLTDISEWILSVTDLSR